MQQKLMPDPFLILVNKPKQYVLVYHPYVTRMYSYVIRMYSYVIRMSLICAHVIRMSLACTRMSSVCHLYVTRIYSYSLVCTCMSSVCHSYVLICHSYVIRMYSYVIRMSLVCSFTMNQFTYCVNFIDSVYFATFCNIL